MSALFFARDPGAANAVATLYNAYDGKKFFVAKDFARQHLTRFEIDYTSFNERVFDKNCTPEDAEIIRSWILSYDGLELIITGTSSPADLTDRLIWNIAAEIGIPTIAILDLSLRIFERFEDGAGIKYSPDFILCPDDHVADHLNKMQIPRKNALTIGRPYLLELYNNRSKWLSKREATRQHLKRLFSRDFETLILFASEVQRTLLPQDSDCAEIKVFKLVKAALPDNTLLMVKLHPREDKAAYKDIHPHVVQGDVGSLPLVAAADVVIGIKSILLIESVVFERPTFSVTRWDKEAKTFLSNQLNLSREISNEKELAQFLKQEILEVPDCKTLSSKLFIDEHWRSTFFSLTEQAKSSIL